MGEIREEVIEILPKVEETKNREMFPFQSVRKATSALNKAAKNPLKSRIMFQIYQFFI